MFLTLATFTLLYISACRILVLPSRLILASNSLQPLCLILAPPFLLLPCLPYSSFPLPSSLSPNSSLSLLYLPVINLSSHSRFPSHQILSSFSFAPLPHSSPLLSSSSIPILPSDLRLTSHLIPDSHFLYPPCHIPASTILLLPSCLHSSLL
jgi:hypothetical protein